MTSEQSDRVPRRIRIPLIAGIVLATIIAGAAAYAYWSSSATETIPFHTLSYGYGAPFYTSTAYLVINDQSSLASVWNSTGACSSQPSCLPPQVDMNQRTVLAVFFGLKGSTGYAINVTQITSGNLGIHVSVLTTFPGTKCSNAAILTAPYHMVDIGKVVNVPISFTSRIQTTVC